MLVEDGLGLTSLAETEGSFHFPPSRKGRLWFDKRRQWEKEEGEGGRIQMTFCWFALRISYCSMSFFWLSSLGILNMVIRWTRSAILGDVGDELSNLVAAAG